MLITLTRRQETGDRQEIDITEIRQETGDRDRETGDRRQEIGRQETGVNPWMKPVMVVSTPTLALP